MQVIEDNDSTYVVNKGLNLHLCLTDKNGNLYDENLVKYVLIHELSHIVDPVYGHGKLFQRINVRLL